MVHSSAVVEEEKFLKALTSADWAALADSTDISEQLPARIAMEYVGDKDLSWSNAQNSLRNGADFVKEMLEMERGNFITKTGLERIESLGSLDTMALKDKAKTAYVLALYLEACVRFAKTKMGIGLTVPAPAPDEPPPEYPIKVHFKEISTQGAEAARWGKTVLFVCNGHAHEVDTFFGYQSVSLIDAKYILNKVSVTKEITVEKMREDLRQRLVSAMKFGQPVHIRMERSAVPFKGTYCAPDLFPEAVFRNNLFQDEAHYKPVIRDSDLSDWPGAFPGRMKDGVYSFVTTDFDMESTREFLPAVLPYFDEMAIVEVDPASFS